MALARTIPLRNYIFTADTLSALIKELSSHYRKPKDESSANHYQLKFSEDELETFSEDSPSKSLDRLVESRISELSLEIECFKPRRSIQLTLYAGKYPAHNKIKIFGDDEDWVHLVHHDVSKLLKNVQPQDDWFNRRRGLFIILFILSSGYVLTKLLLMFTGPLKGSNDWSQVIGFWFIAFLLGMLPTVGLIEFLNRAYPSIEIQTGPKQNWKPAILRGRLKFVIGLFVVAPVGRLIYDIYRWFPAN